MIPRVYAPDAVTAGTTVALDDDESAHLVRVRRLGPGAAVRVFDGRGREWLGAIDRAAKTGVTVRLDAPSTPVAEPRIPCTIALAVLKGDATDEAVRDVVMLGAAAVQPFVATRSEVTLSALARGHRAARWTRVAVASAKQSGRAVVPVVREPVPVETLLAGTEGLRLLLVEPGIAGAVAVAELPPPVSVTLAVGPEGGWTVGELQAARGAGWTAVTLGARVLRAVAAPLVGMAACQAVWRD